MRCHSLNRCASLIGAALAVLSLLALPARGQIAVVVDEHGHRIFVNETERPAASKRLAGKPISARAGTPANPPAEISALVDNAATRLHIDPKLVQAMIQVESGYNPRAVSRKGAQGLMQLMPATAERFGVQNSFNPKQNINGGVTYLKYLLELFGGNVPLSVAAYNAGEHAVERNGGIPPITETRNYVRKVTGLYGYSDALLRTTASTIYRTVDENGMVHYTNDGM